ncbi:MAG: hypothetical protein Kow0022_15900 [Phycisphaerales bacterium]
MRRPAWNAVVGAVLIATGCGRPQPDRPPAVRLDDSVCDQCGMIISDVRWATSTIIRGERGPEARLFDDFNCQVNYEQDHPDLPVLARWSHDHATQEWMKTDQAVFLVAPALRTPMGSHAAAFGNRSDADSAASTHPGTIMTFEQVWAHLRRPDAGPTSNAAEPELPADRQPVP